MTTFDGKVKYSIILIQEYGICSGIGRKEDIETNRNAGLLVSTGMQQEIEIGSFRLRIEN